MSDELSNHIPLYPDPKTDEDYNAQIHAKHEYRIHSARAPQRSDTYFNHQTLTQIHMGSQTPNKMLFLFKDPGLGKTCDAIGLAETRHEWLGQILDTNDRILSDPDKKLNKAVIVAQNKTTLNDNFKKDIISTCTNGNYITEALETKVYKLNRTKESAKTRSINTAYELWTHTAFANHLDKYANNLEVLSKRYSFRVLIFDEIHDYKTFTRTTINQDGEVETQGSKLNYDRTMRLIDNIYGSVIIVLSATPIVNDINEFPSVINFVLDKIDRINPEEFRRITAVNNPKDPAELDAMRQRLELFLVPKLRGRVSRMHLSDAMSRAVVRTNEDPNAPPVLSFSDKKLWLDRLDNNNNEYIDYTYLIQAYANAYAEDTSGQNQFYQNSIFADNVIWPGGTYGTHAIKMYVESSSEDLSFRFTELFMQDFRAHVDNSRKIFIREHEKEIVQLQSRRDEVLKVNPSASVASIDEEIESKRADIEIFQERIRKNPYGTVDVTNDVDLFIMIYVIRSRYSPVYASTIEKIIGIERYNQVSGKFEYVVTHETNSFNIERFDENDEDNRECVYIYNYYKTGGIVPMGLFLEFFGYSMLPVHGASFVSSSGQILLSRAKRYAFLYSSSDKDSTGSSQGKMSDAKARMILELMNHPANKYGHYLKVVIGTDVSAQGLNFLNIRQAHFTGRGWNEATNIQTEGRVDRPGSSHKSFHDDDPVPEFEFIDYDTGKESRVRYNVVMKGGVETQKYVKVFRHVAYYANLNVLEGDHMKNLSIGLKMYDDAAMKELTNSIPVDIMKTISYDYILNIQSGEELTDVPLGFASPESTNPSAIKPYEEDFVTYNIFHARKELEWIKCRVRGHFKTYFKLTLSNLVKICKGSHSSTVIKALTEMVNDNERIIDRHGMINYIREDGDIFFLQKLSRTLRNREEQLLSYYSSHNFVRAGTSLDEMYDILESERVDEALLQILSLSPDQIPKITHVLNSLSNKSKGFLVETLVTRHRELVVEGKLSPNMLNTIFQLLHPAVAFAQNNGIIIHVFYLRSRQDTQSGGHGAGGKIPSASNEELRIFVISEGVWRNSRFAEDATFIPLLNDHIVRTLSQNIKDFPLYGTSQFTQTDHIFKLQDKEHIRQTSSRRTKTGQINKKSASGEGKAAYSYNKEMQSWHLFSVQVDLYVSVMTYPPKYINGALIKPVFMVKLKKDPNGTLSKGSVRLSVDGDHGAPFLSLTNDVNIDTTLPYRTNEIMHYTRAYPEILGWIFLDELAAADPDVMSSRNAFFYPSIKVTSGNKMTYRPQLPPLKEGQHYATLLDALPNGLHEIGLFLMGQHNAVPAGVIKVPGGDEINFSNDCIIMRSLNMLYDHIVSGLGLESEMLTFPYQKSTLGIEVTVGKRFYEAWNSKMNKQSMVVMIYILYYLQGSISLVT